MKPLPPPSILSLALALGSLLTSGPGLAQHGYYAPISKTIAQLCPTCTKSDVSETISNVWTWEGSNYSTVISPSAFLQLRNLVTHDSTIYEIFGMSRYYYSTDKTIGIGFPASAPPSNATYYFPTALPGGTYFLTMSPFGNMEYDEKVYLTAESDPRLPVPTDPGDDNKYLRAKSGVASWQTVSIPATPTLGQAATAGGFAGTETIAPGRVKQAYQAMPSDVPASPNAADCEFTSGICAGYTWHSTVAPSGESTATAGWLIESNGAVAKGDYLQKAVNLTGDFTVTGYVSQNSNSYSGIFAADTNGTGWSCVMFTQGNAAQSGYGASGTLTTWAHGLAHTISYYGIQGRGFVQLERVGDKIDCAWSQDGMAYQVVWQYIDPATPSATAVAYMGLRYESADSGDTVYPSLSAYDFVRVTTP